MLDDQMNGSEFSGVLPECKSTVSDDKQLFLLGLAAIEFVQPLKSHEATGLTHCMLEYKSTSLKRKVCIVF